MFNKVSQYVVRKKENKKIEIGILITLYDDKNRFRINVVWANKGVRICFQDEEAIILNATKNVGPLCEALKRPNLALLG